MNTKLFFSKNFLLVILFVFAFVSYPVFSQDDKVEDYSWENENDNTEQKTPYFALSFGANASFLFMKYDDINHKPLPGSLSWKELLDKEFSGPMISYGFNFFTALSPLVNNARLGVSYQNGSRAIESTTSATYSGGTEELQKSNVFRSISVQATGVHFDYAIVPIKSLAILPGLGVKFGSMTLEQYITFDAPRWDLKQDKLSIANSFNEKLEYAFCAVEPQINIEYAITSFLMFRASASYMLTVDNPFYKNAWTINGDNTYSGVPKSVKPQGFSVSAGLYIGLFNY
ncbi:hypothetical protein SDC9_144477 [bioreactor metagenome]|uniref:Outer membrane protein beta-barrel domain-containing protein n=1 Tax=bioreactor metagenome TaxID=1076179 RepID=A0A645E670_9ZZZZ